MKPAHMAALVGAVALALLTVLWIYPPFFGIDMESGGRLHTGMGHWPRWDPPTPVDVCEALRARQQASGSEAALECPPSPARQPAFRTGVNRVLQVFETTGLLLAGAAWLVVTRMRSVRRARRGAPKSR